MNLRLLSLVSVLATLATHAVAQTPPNVVYVMADELGYYELAHMGNANLRTPNLDRMAVEGMRFTQFLAGSPLCAPTRCTLMTGKHSGHTSVRSNGGGTPLREDEVTVATLLKRAGYATGGFGKWGCGGRGSTGVPEKHGFDTFFGYYDQVHAHTYYPAYLVENSAEVTLAGNAGGRSGETYSHYVIFDRAKEFIRDHRRGPFFCYLPVTPPHGLFDIPEDDPAWTLYADEPWPLEARRYAAMVAMLDRQMGELFALLDELELTANTLVFFCGDNGGNDYFRDDEHPRGFHGPNVDPRSGKAFRGHKGNLYEGGLRIPFLARWPGRIAPGTVSDQLGYFPDVLPTLAELAGVDVPNDVDGLSIVPTLLGEERAGRAQEQHAFLYWELGPQTAVRQGSWKAIRPRPRAAWELYDLSSDIEEANDVANEHPDRLAAMMAFAEQAHMPVVEGTFASRTLHERDRQAKGMGGNQRASGPVRSLPSEGAIPNTNWKIVRVSSESEANARLARHAIDGDPRTHWHTRFGEDLATHPHELVIDLGATYTVRGFRYLARQDGGWNGAFGKCTFTVSDDATTFGTPQATTTFQRTKEPQEVSCASVRGRYVRVHVLSEVGGGPWASAAEIGIVGE